MRLVTKLANLVTKFLNLVTMCAVAVVAAGCDDAPTPPVFDSLTMPDTATLDTASNSYVLKGSMSFHDPIATITTLEIIVPTNKTTEKDVAINSSGGVVNPLVVQFDAATPKGVQMYSLVLVDDQMQSAEVDKTVTLQ